MADLTRAAGKPIAMKFGDQELLLSPITLGDLAEFEKDCKERRVDAFMKAAVKMKMEKNERLEGMTRILTIPFSNEDFATEMNTTNGVRFLLWRSIHRNDPKFTLEDVGKLEDLDAIMNAVSSISSLGRFTESPPVPGEANGSTGTDPSPA